MFCIFFYFALRVKAKTDKIFSATVQFPLQHIGLKRIQRLNPYSNTGTEYNKTRISAPLLTKLPRNHQKFFH